MAISNDLLEKHLCETFMAMCTYMPIEKITVTRLIRQVGCARQTFYNYFSDINDLIRFIPINYLKTALSDLHDGDGVRRAYAYALEHPAFFTQLPRLKGQGDFRENFSSWLKNSFYELYLSRDMTYEEQLKRKLSIDMYCYGITDVFLDWCKAGLSWPLEIVLEAQSAARPPFMPPVHRFDEGAPADRGRQTGAAV
jgi:hypothetical protein